MRMYLHARRMRWTGADGQALARKHVVTAPLIVLAFASIPGASAAARAYRPIDLGTLPGFPDSFATAINGRAGVAGFAGAGPALQHAFLFTRSRGMLDLGTLPGGSRSQATGLTNHRMVVAHTLASAIRVPVHTFGWHGRPRHAPRRQPQPGKWNQQSRANRRFVRYDWRRYARLRGHLRDRHGGSGNAASR
jgi:probable HAF family extracellular repeat protein